ncbi:MAG: GAF domain-containing protein [Thermodesulfobacteriota bacterium]
MRWVSENKVYFRFGISVLCLVIIVFLSYRSTSQQIKNEAAEDQTYEALIKLQLIFSYLKDAESGARGYVITGIESNLEQYFHAQQKIEREISETRRALGDSPSLLLNLVRLESLISERLNLINQTIELRKKYGFEAAKQLLMKGRGNELSDYIRDAINQIENEGITLLRSRVGEEEESKRLMILVYAVGILLAILFAGLSITTIRRDLTKHRQAETEHQTREKHQQALVELGQVALGGTDLLMLMNEAVSQVAKTLEVEYVKILELQPDSDSLLLRAGVGWKDGLVGHATIGVGVESQGGFTLVSKEPVIMDDIIKENRFSAPPLLKDHNVASGISTTIHGKEGPYGVLGAHSVSKRTYTKDEIHFLQSVANLISEAVERNRVQDELRITNSIMESVNKSSKLVGVFETAIDRVLELTDINIVGIYLIDEATNEAVLEAHRGYSGAYIERAGRIPYPKGVTWKVIGTGETYVVQDVSIDPYVGEAGRDGGFQSFLSVPIKVGERAIGAIHFHSFKRNYFGRREIDLLNSIGTQIAIAVSKAKQTEDLKLINEDLHTLNVITTSVHKSLNLEEVLNIALDKVVEITEFDIIMVYLVDDETNEAVLKVHRGLTEDYIERAGRIAYPKGVTWRVIKSGEPHYSEDVQKDPDLGPAGKALGHHTHVSVPMIQENKTIGVVNFASRRVLGLSSRDINLLNAIGNQIGTSMVQASLYERSQKQSEELRGLYRDLDERRKDLEIVNTITQAVHKSLDLMEIYEIALDSVVDLEDVDMAMIYLVDEDRKEAILQAQRNLPQDYINRAGRIPYLKGTTWHVINKGEVVHIEDIQKDPTVGPAGREIGHHSALGIPLKIEEKVIGVFWFLSYREHKFDKQEIDLLSSIGDQIATAIAKAKLYQDSNRRHEQIELVYELSKSLNMDLSLDVVLSKIIEVARQLVKARYSALAIFDENNKISRFTTNLTPEEINLIGTLPEGKGLLGELFRDGKLLRLDDITKHPRAVGFPPNHPPMKTLLGAPIIMKGHTIGALYLTEKEGGMPFDKDDAELVGTLCSAAGISLENARLFKKIADSESELKEANERLLELDEMKDEFISMASHELRTPLTAINSFISMLLDGDYGSLPPEAVEALADMNTAAKRLIGLTNYMLDVSRIEEGRLQFKIFDFDIGEVCEKVINDLTPIAEGKGLTIEYQKPPLGGTLLVSGDKFRVEQIIVNLIDNALKYTDSGSVAISHHDNGPLITTHVIDTGIGVPQQHQKLLFQKFRAVHHSLSDQYKGGTGMGLYICKLLLSEMKGDILLEKSELGQGSTFSFSLPKAKT